MLLRFETRFFCLLALLASSAWGQDQWLQGKVFLPNGRPLERSVRVDIRGPRASDQTVDTNSSGSFSIRVNVLGTYTIVVDAGEEFEVATQSILVDNLLLMANSKSDGMSTWINIYLKAKDHTVITTPTTLDSKLANVPKKALDHYGKGLKHALANEFVEAAAELQKAIQAHPNFSQAQVELGKVFLKLSRFEEASAALRAALTSDPNNFAGRLHLGMALLNQKKFDEAIPELALAADLDKTSVTPHYYTGVMRYETGSFELALAAFEKANSLNGDKPFPHLHRYLASLYLKNAKWELAITELEKYLAQAPNAPDAAKIRSAIAETRSKMK